MNVPTPTGLLPWLAWIAAFFVLEGKGLASKRKGDTLTDHLRFWFGVTGKGPVVKLRRFALLAGLAWLSAHLLTVDKF